MKHYIGNLKSRNSIKFSFIHQSHKRKDLSFNRVGQNCAITASTVRREEVLQQQHGALLTWEEGNKIEKMSGKVMSMQRKSDRAALDTNSVRNWQTTESRHDLQVTLFWCKFLWVLSASYLNYAAGSMDVKKTRPE